METVGAIAQYDSGTGKFNVHINGSMYNYLGFTMAGALGIPGHKLNLIPCIAGGSFGSNARGDKESVRARSGVWLQAEAGAADRFVKGDLSHFELRIGTGHFEGSIESEIFRTEFRRTGDVIFRQRALNGRERLFSRKWPFGAPDGDDLRN